MKPTRNPFTAALFAALVVSPLAQAATHTSTSTTGTNTWSSGTGWSSIPASGIDTILTFGNGTSLAASAAVVSNNDIVGVFKLNNLNMTYAGPASGTAPTVTISGNQLEFINNTGAVAPTMVFSTTGTVKPSVTISAPILFTNTTAITATTDAIFSGTLSGTGGFTKSGAGTLRVTNTATASGGAALGNIGVSAGTLQIGSNGGFGSLGSGTITLSGSGSFNVARASNSFNLDNTITGSTSGAVNFYLNNSSGSFAVTLTKANTYTAATNLQPFSNTSVGTPTLKNGIDNAVSTTTAFTINTVSGATAVMTYDLNGFNQTIGSLASGAGVTTGNGIVTNSGAAKTLIISNASGSTTYAGTISGAIALTKSGNSTQVLSGTNSYTGNTSISAGTLNLTGSLSGGGAVATSGTGILSQGTASVISGASTVTQGSSGTSILAGSNSYSGLTTVNAGVLQVNHANALGDATNGTNVNGSDGSVNFLGTVLDLNGVSVGSGEALTLDTGTTVSNRVTLRSMSGTSSAWTGNVVLAGSRLVQFQTNNASAQLEISGPISQSSFTGTLNLRGAGTGTLSGGISIASTNNIQILDGGTWNINTTGNTWGSTSLSNGTLVTGAANALPTSQFITFGQSSNSGTLKLNGFDQIVGGLAVSGSGTANKIVNGSATASTLTVSHASSNSTFSGVLGGAGANENNFGLTKSGNATLTLSGTNTYTGTTKINQGGLIVGDGTSGSLANTSVTVGGNGSTGTPTLGGRGTIAGATTISSSGTGVVGIHAPGVTGANSGVGTQTFSNSLTYQAGSIFSWDLKTGAVGTAGTDFDAVALDTATGSLTVDGNATTGAIFKVVLGVAFVGGNAFWSDPAQKSWNVFAATNSATLGSDVFSRFQLFDTSSATVPVSYTSFGSFGFTNNGSTGTLTWTAVPEPTSALAGLLITAGLLRRRRVEIVSRS